MTRLRIHRNPPVLTPEKGNVKQRAARLVRVLQESAFPHQRLQPQIRICWTATELIFLLNREQKYILQAIPLLGGLKCGWND